MFTNSTLKTSSLIYAPYCNKGGRDIGPLADKVCCGSRGYFLKYYGIRENLNTPTGTLATFLWYTRGVRLNYVS